jgi:hypothetical protein
MQSKVIHEGQLTEAFDITTGVRHGYLLSPLLFLLAVDWIMKKATDGRKNGIQWTMFNQLDDLDFATDIAFLSHSHLRQSSTLFCFVPYVPVFQVPDPHKRIVFTLKLNNRT